MGRDRRYPRGSLVYWVGGTDPQLPIKVGYTRNIAIRIRRLQGASPVELYLIAYLPGTLSTEKALHDRLAPHRSHLEWFERRPALIVARQVHAVFLEDTALVLRTVVARFSNIEIAGKEVDGG